MSDAPEHTFYIDCEFDGHNGPLLSIAMVREDGWGLHVEVAGVLVEDQWVAENVLPIMGSHSAQISCRVRPHEVGRQLRFFIGDCQNPTIIADSPVDIGRFCRAISTGEDGGWASADYSGMTFIVHNVNCYPTTLEGAVQHNAWWDAMALRAIATPAALAASPEVQALIAEAVALERERCCHEGWKWYGYAGHLIVSAKCAYHLCTRVGEYLVSTVGDYRPNGGQADTIGSGPEDFFETFVFRCHGEEGGNPNVDYGEIDSNRYPTSLAAELGHYAMCWKWHAIRASGEGER